MKCKPWHRIFSSKRVFLAVIGWSTALTLLTIVFSAFVPYNMDEFIAYDTIVCYLFPNNFHGICDQWLLSLPGTTVYLPLKSYWYTGSIPVVWYLPLFFTWNSPVAVRLIGVAFLAASAWILGKYFNIRFRYILALMLLCFPYAWHYFVDAGLTAAQMFSIYGCLHLSKCWIHEKKFKHILGIGGIIFIGIWIKFTYFWLLPGILLMILLELWNNRKALGTTADRNKLALQSIVTSLLTLWIVLLFLHAQSADGKYQNLDQLSSAHIETFSILEKKIPEGATIIYRVLLNPLSAVKTVFLLPSSSANRYAWSNSLFSVLLYLFTPFFTLTLWGVLGIPLKKFFLANAYYLVFLLTVIVIAATNRAYGMHHVILAYPFLFIGIFSIVRVILDHVATIRRSPFITDVLVLWVIAFFIVNAGLYLTAFRLPIRPDSDWSKQEIHRILARNHLQEKYVIVGLDWGVYFYQGLFARRSQALWDGWRLNNKDNLKRMIERARSIDRKLLFIYTQPSLSNLEMIQATLDLKRCEGIEETAVWQILAEPDEAFQSACGQAIPNGGPNHLSPWARMLHRLSLIF